MKIINSSINPLSWAAFLFVICCPMSYQATKAEVILIKETQNEGLESATYTTRNKSLTKDDLLKFFPIGKYTLGDGSDYFEWLSSFNSSPTEVRDAQGKPTGEYLYKLNLEGFTSDSNNDNSPAETEYFKGGTPGIKFEWTGGGGASGDKPPTLTDKLVIVIMSPAEGTGKGKEVPDSGSSLALLAFGCIAVAVLGRWPYFARR